MQIEPDDLLARAIFFADQFDGDQVANMKLVQFRGNRNKDGSFDESLFLLKLIADADVHELGCKKEASMNERQSAKRLKQGKPPDPEPGVDKRYYCGFNRAPAGKLSPKGANYVVELDLAPEDGLKAHVSVSIRPTGQNKIEPGDLTEAGRALALAFADPEPHICPSQETDPMHPIARWGAACLEVS